MLNSRRGFLADVCRGTLIATVGSQVASELGLAGAFATEAPATLDFGEIEPLVRLMQETPADKLLPLLADRLHSGMELKRLVQAGALANARTFGGEDYIGFHTMMALGPSLHMAYELPTAQQALPVFKVLYRNTNRIQELGGRKNETLHPVEATEISAGEVWGEKIREAVRNKNLAGAEKILAAVAKSSPEDAYNHLLFAVQDATYVHRVALPYRAWEFMSLIVK
jgi:hypothetical protein